MEGVLLRGKWKKKSSIFTRLSSLLLLCLLAPTLSELPPSSEGPQVEHIKSRHEKRDIPCPEGDYRGQNGVCCKRCSPGEKLVKDCPNESSRTDCQQCSIGRTYQEENNHSRNCHRCTLCKEFEDEVSPCKKHKNTVCRCKEGFYRNVIDSLTRECLQCKSCGPGEFLTSKCTPESNTECECQPSFYRFYNKCLPCTDCTDGCENLCASGTHPKTLTTTRKSLPSFEPWIYLAPAIFVVLLVIVILATYLVTKKHETKKIKLKMLDAAILSETISQDSQKLTTSLINYRECSEKELDEALPFPTQGCECAHLPKEIKIHQLIYSVLDLVPVRLVKQLVRSLGVSERDIERAEMDHRTVQDAHYQMFKVWAVGGANVRGGGEVLSHHFLLDLLEKLREMNLDGIAEELEAKFRIQ